MPISPLLLLLFSPSLSLLLVDAARTADGSEEWGYVQVRPRAHMFWWLYRSPQRVDNGSAPWPTVLWLQGGPGGSGVGIGNFQEIGPVDANLQPRSSTWLRKADLLFVDNPVGTGYSFVEDESLFVTSDWEAATDLTTLLKNLYHEQASSWQNSPLFIVAESYGGKFAVTAGLSIAQAIRAGELKLNLGGVALGDSWISPEDFVLSWAPLLLDLSRIDIIDAEKSSIIAEKIREEIKKEQYGDATNSWGELEEFIVTSSNDVVSSLRSRNHGDQFILITTTQTHFQDFYNFLLDSGSDPVSLTAAAEASRKLSLKMYPTYLSSKASTSLDISGLMNGVIKEKLKIIPKNVSWGGQSGLVFDSLSNDFMKPRINEVDELLSLGINVTIYNGQVDLICATKGTEAWVQKLKWDGLKNFNSMDRKPIYCSSEEVGVTKGFLKSYQNLHFYWILGAGHFVPVDQPCVSLKMIADITRSPPAGPS